MIFHPIFEVLSYYSIADIHDPLIRHLEEVRFIGKIHIDIWLCESIGEYLLNTKALILWNVNALNLVIVKICFLALQDVLKKVDGNIV